MLFVDVHSLLSRYNSITFIVTQYRSTTFLLDKFGIHVYILDRTGVGNIDALILKMGICHIRGTNRWQNQAVFLICIRPPIKKKGVDTLVKLNGYFSKIRFFRNNRIPGQFAMCVS